MESAATVFSPEVLKEIERSKHERELDAFLDRLLVYSICAGPNPRTRSIARIAERLVHYFDENGGLPWARM